MDDMAHPEFIETYKWDKERLDYFLVKREPYEEWLAKKQARSERAKKAMETRRRRKAEARRKEQDGDG